MEVELVTQHIWGWNVRKIFILVNIKNGETRSKTRRIPSQWGYVKLFIYKYVFLIFMFKQLWNCSSLTGVQDARAWWPCVCVGGGGGTFGPGGSWVECHNQTKRRVPSTWVCSGACVSGMCSRWPFRLLGVTRNNLPQCFTGWKTSQPWLLVLQNTFVVWRPWIGFVKKRSRRRGM